MLSFLGVTNIFQSTHLRFMINISRSRLIALYFWNRFVIISSNLKGGLFFPQKRQPTFNYIFPREMEEGGGCSASLLKSLNFLLGNENYLNCRSDSKYITENL